MGYGLWFTDQRLRFRVRVRVKVKVWVRFLNVITAIEMYIHSCGLSGCAYRKVPKLF